MPPSRRRRASWVSCRSSVPLRLSQCRLLDQNPRQLPCLLWREHDVADAVAFLVQVHHHVATVGVDLQIAGDFFSRIAHAAPLCFWGSCFPYRSSCVGGGTAMSHFEPSQLIASSMALLICRLSTS